MGSRTILLYHDAQGRIPFREWVHSLDDAADARVATALKRLEQGNDSSLHGIGGGVSELRIHSGPGYRIYLGQDGPVLVILLGGGTKHRQQHDIDIAKARWIDYQRRRRTGA